MHLGIVWGPVDCVTIHIESAQCVWLNLCVSHSLSRGIGSGYTSNVPAPTDSPWYTPGGLKRLLAASVASLDWFLLVRELSFWPLHFRDKQLEKSFQKATRPDVRRGTRTFACLWLPTIIPLVVLICLPLKEHQQRWIFTRARLIDIVAFISSFSFLVFGILVLFWSTFTQCWTPSVGGHIPVA
eukprot:Blabericola_migrator_1__3646@NODE_2092_length_3290_cov_10_497983_g1326_i0_p1_GENE_NODE_2092_length_3290_cov_10_497983_g1326_i0NODE_2092_length_3290_cov_10_497983_g1326_i0_p1_ORF_typecomplete_len184_score14_14Bap31/PF05529_12/0_24_NODE_2092_length_3290_cov_10_497983_g1326_i0391942